MIREFWEKTSLRQFSGLINQRLAGGVTEAAGRVLPLVSFGVAKR